MTVPSFLQQKKCPLKIRIDLRLYEISGRVRNLNLRVPLNTESMFQRVPLEVGDQNFAGAIYRKLKFERCLAPVAPVLTRPLMPRSKLQKSFVYRKGVTLCLIFLSYIFLRFLLSILGNQMFMRIIFYAYSVIPN